jgi:hypothetical protein
MVLPQILKSVQNAINKTPLLIHHLTDYAVPDSPFFQLLFLVQNTINTFTPQNRTPLKEYPRDRDHSDGYKAHE